MKTPILILFVGDYLSDPKLSLCCPATRGVWMDFLCVMTMNDRCGVIAGTRDQLARLGRCPSVDVSSAIAELDSTKTADVTERNSVVTLICRRMKREADARKQGLLRSRRHRATLHVTPLKPDNLLYGDGTGPQSALLEVGSGEKPTPEVSPAAAILAFLNEITGRSFRAIDVNIKPIEARLKEVDGDVEGVKIMLSRQCARWKGTDQEEYLRPETLFGK